jgi:hypothetical protein
MSYPSLVLDDLGNAQTVTLPPSCRDQQMSTCEEEIEEVVGCSIESIEESEYISSCYIISDKTRYS